MTSTTTTTSLEDELEWEEWDGKGSFGQHCVAGSMAGVAEHVCVYPLDTVKTHLQCAACPAARHNNGVASKTTTRAVASSSLHGGIKSSSSLATTTTNNTGGMWTTIRHLVSTAHPTATTMEATSPTTTTSIAGVTRLWRGVYTILIGCIPAHALYFGLYETVKLASVDESTGKLSSVGAMMAGAAATAGHDCIMTPLDTMKQRLQLGHYSGMMACAKQMYWKEGGLQAFYRSLPVTLLSNVPYGMIMVSTNEFCKWQLQHFVAKGEQQAQAQYPSLTTALVSSSIAGMVAAATTTPLDRIKTVLQTQQLQPATCTGTCPKLPSGSSKRSVVDAISLIYKQEGYAGFMRGMVPRMVSHTPAVAISWTTYESAKKYLSQQEWL